MLPFCEGSNGSPCDHRGALDNEWIRANKVGPVCGVNLVTFSIRKLPGSITGNFRDIPEVIPCATPSLLCKLVMLLVMQLVMQLVLVAMLLVTM